MLKKLTALSLSLLLCMALLPGQASATDVPENELPVQAEDVENQISPEGTVAGLARGPVPPIGPSEGGTPGGVIGAGDLYGNGIPWGGGTTP